MDIPETTFIFIASRKFIPRLQSNSGKKDALFSPPYLFLSLSFSFMPLAVTHKIGSAGFTLYSYIGWPSFDKEICHGEIFHSLESDWLSLKGPEMLGGVAGAALCCTALTQAIRAGAPGRQAGIDKMLLCDEKNSMI